jgi:exopolyphosphatase/guanosine-5'-triphosphate,3'-diphosphate pyrophosphatase
VTRVLAAADIGSNTAHLLVAATDGSLVMRIDNYNEWIPLGETVARAGVIPKEQSQQLVLAVKEFKRVARERQAHSLYVFATEGLRAASNHLQVVKKIASETGILVDVVSARKEAELSLAGVRLDTRNLDPELLLEVGGGSAQIGLVAKGTFLDEESLPLGTGRVIAEAGLRNPVTSLGLRAAERYIEEVLDGARIKSTGGVAVASGGVARGLWRALHPDGDKVIAMEEIEFMAWTSARLPVDRIITRFGVKTRRAGTLLPGALIYRALMRRFGIRELMVSEFGIREGAVLGMALGQLEGCPV